MSDTAALAKKVHAQMVFIHQLLTQRTQYFVDEFEIARDATATITEMANKLSDQIKASEVPSNEAANEQE